MKYIRKLTGLLLLCALLLTLPLPTRAASILKGDCGDNLRWELNRDTGMLTISGTGAMDDYTSLNESPWSAYSDEITGITVKSGVTTIGDRAFFWCRSSAGITSVSLPETLRSIGDSAFAGTAITQITIPASVTKIAEDAFSNADLKKITVSSDNDYYSSDSKGVLYNKKKTKLIAFPAGYEGSYTFPDTVKTISKYACTYVVGLTSVTFSEGVQTIEEGAFMGCHGLKTVNLPDTLTSIGKESFGYCYALKTVNFPKNLVSIGDIAFIFCSDLLAVEFTGKAPDIHENAFWGVTINAYYPKNNSTWTEDVLQNYGGTVTWKEEGLDILQQPKSVKAADGTKATVRVIAHGDGLKYQWYVKNADASSYSKSSVTTSTYSVTMNEERAGRRVYCVVTDKYGNRLKSNGVRLSMTESVKITQQPKAVTAEENERIKVTVAAEGDGLSYQWYYANRGSSKFSKASFTTDTYKMTMTEARAGRRVYCVVTDKYGKTAKSDTVTLRMDVPELKITTQPKSVTVAEGERATVTVAAQGRGLTYQWYYANAGKSSFAKAAITEKSYSLIMSEARAGRRLYCVVTDINGDQVKSKTVKLHME